MLNPFPISPFLASKPVEYKDLLYSLLSYSKATAEFQDAAAFYSVFHAEACRSASATTAQHLYNSASALSSIPCLAQAVRKVQFLWAKNGQAFDVSIADEPAVCLFNLGAAWTGSTDPPAASPSGSKSSFGGFALGSESATFRQRLQRMVDLTGAAVDLLGEPSEERSSSSRKLIQDVRFWLSLLRAIQAELVLVSFIQGRGFDSQIVDEISVDVAVRQLQQKDFLRMAELALLVSRAYRRALNLPGAQSGCNRTVSNEAHRRSVLYQSLPHALCGFLGLSSGTPGLAAYAALELKERYQAAYLELEPWQEAYVRASFYGSGGTGVPGGAQDAGKRQEINADEICERLLVRELGDAPRTQLEMHVLGDRTLGCKGPAKTFLEQGVVYIRQGLLLLRIKMVQDGVYQETLHTFAQEYEGQLNAFFRGVYYEAGLSGLFWLDVSGAGKPQSGTVQLKEQLLGGSPFQFQEGKVFVAQTGALHALVLKRENSYVERLLEIQLPVRRVFQYGRAALGVVIGHSSATPVPDVAEVTCGAASVGSPVGSVRNEHFDTESAGQFYLYDLAKNALTASGETPRPSPVSADRESFQVEQLQLKGAFLRCRGTVTNGVAYITDCSGRFRVVSCRDSSYGKQNVETDDSIRLLLGDFFSHPQERCSKAQKQEETTPGYLALRNKVYYLQAQLTRHVSEMARAQLSAFQGEGGERGGQSAAEQKISALERVISRSTQQYQGLINAFKGLEEDFHGIVKQDEQLLLQSTQATLIESLSRHSEPMQQSVQLELEEQLSNARGEVKELQIQLKNQRELSQRLQKDLNLLQTSQQNSKLLELQEAVSTLQAQNARLELKAESAEKQLQEHIQKLALSEQWVKKLTASENAFREKADTLEARLVALTGGALDGGAAGQESKEPAEAPAAKQAAPQLTSDEMWREMF